MADPRFYDNRGPLTLGELCDGAGLAVPQDADRASRIFDVAGLTQAGGQHISFFSGVRAREALASTKAGWCLIGKDELRSPPKGTAALRVDSPAEAFAAVARLFYPEYELIVRAQDERIHPTARIGDGVVLAPGVVVGPGVEIGRGTRIGANTVIGRGVAVGRNCEVGSNAGISFAYVGDNVVVQSGAQIGGSGFGFSSDARGHKKIPQLGRVIIQDGVEVGANTTIDRGALADTVIGEGTKIDNLVQVGHNVRIGRQCIIVAHVGISGSVTIGDCAVLGGKVGVADHVTIGDGARIAGMAGVMWNLEGGREYCGIPARPAREFFREVATLAKLAKSRNKSGHE